MSAPLLRWMLHQSRYMAKLSRLRAPMLRWARWTSRKRAAGAAVGAMARRGGLSVTPPTVFARPEQASGAVINAPPLLGASAMTTKAITSERNGILDPTECYRRFCVALLEEDTDEAREAYNDLRAWLERGGFEPVWTPVQRRQFFTFNPSTGRLG